MPRRRLRAPRRALAAVAVRLYGLLLRCYPRDFRSEFGDEMGAALRRKCLDPRSTWIETLRFLWSAGVDLPPTALAERRPAGSALLTMLADFLDELRHALRRLRHRPGYAVVAVAILGLGIGATTMIFTLVNGLYYRPLAYPEADRLVSISQTLLGTTSTMAVSYPDYVDWRDRSQSFERMGAYLDTTFNLGVDGSPVRVSGGRVSVSLLESLGVEPQLGRFFLPEEELVGGPNVVLLSDTLWRRQFARDPGIVGAAVRLHGTPHTVVGVMPAEFHFAEYSELWVPLRVDPAVAARTNHSYEVVGRLQCGVSRQQARAEMVAIAEDLAAEHPGSNADIGVRLVSLRERLSGGDENPVPLLMATAVFVVMIATVNVAGLTLGHAATRDREMAIRSALGARRTRVVLQLVCESAVVAGCGGLVGLLVGRWGKNLLVASIPIDLPLWLEFHLDARVFAFVAAVAAGVAILLTLVPARHLSRLDLSGPLRRATSGWSGAPLRSRNVLVVLEMALAVTLLAGAGLMFRGVLALKGVAPGFAHEDRVAFKVALPRTSYPEGSQVTDFYERLAADVGALPGVQSVEATTAVPLSGAQWRVGVEGENADPEERPAVNNRIVSNGYFAAMEIALLRGRSFDRRDEAAGAPRVAVINEALARYLWPEANPLGRRLRYWTPDGDQPWLTVIGVIQGVVEDRLDRPIRPTLYVPLTQNPYRNLTIVVHASADPAAVLGMVRDTVLQLDADLPVYQATTLTRLLEGSSYELVLSSWLLGCFAAFALAVAALGVHGLVGYSVAQRRQEIGLRMALGARAGEVTALIVRQGLAIAAAGSALGMVGAVSLGRLLSSLLFEVSPTDPAVLAVVGTVLTGVALLATWIPARAATRVDPSTTLRAE